MKGGPMNAIVLMSDPKVAAVPLIESGERLVDVRPGGRLLVDTRKQDQADAFAHLREGVLERLLTAQTMLPTDIRLLFVEGYRPPLPPAGVLRKVRRPAAGRQPRLVLP